MNLPTAGANTERQLAPFRDLPTLIQCRPDSNILVPQLKADLPRFTRLDVLDLLEAAKRLDRLWVVVRVRRSREADVELYNFGGGHAPAVGDLGLERQCDIVKSSLTVDELFFRLLDRRLILLGRRCDAERVRIVERSVRKPVTKSEARGDVVIVEPLVVD